MRLTLRKIPPEILPETMQKLCLSAKFPHQEIRWNYSAFGSVINDIDLTFEEHIIYFCQTENYRFHAFRAKRMKLTLDKARTLDFAFVKGSFNYATMIWIFCKKKVTQKLKRNIIHGDTCYNALWRLITKDLLIKGICKVI